MKHGSPRKKKRRKTSRGSKRGVCPARAPVYFADGLSEEVVVAAKKMASTLLYEEAIVHGTPICVTLLKRGPARDRLIFEFRHLFVLASGGRPGRALGHGMVPGGLYRRLSLRQISTVLAGIFGELCSTKRGAGRIGRLCP